MRTSQPVRNAMKSLGLRIVAAGLACCGVAWAAGAQDAPKPTDPKPAYLDTSLPPEQRTADLVGRMTLEEKATQLVNQARAVRWRAANPFSSGAKLRNGGTASGAGMVRGCRGSPISANTPSSIWRLRVRAD